MRASRRRLVVLCCAAFLSACAGGTGGAFQPRAGDGFSVKRSANSTGSLSDLASQVTTDTLLRYKGARLLKAQPFAACPGEAGEQTFSVRTPRGPAVLRVGFTQWNGTTVIASYRRPQKAPDDPAALDAMRRDICSPTL